MLSHILLEETEGTAPSLSKHPRDGVYIPEQTPHSRAFLWCNLDSSKVFLHHKDMEDFYYIETNDFFLYK